ncbi:kinase-like domain-containing protein [Trametes maxima]|nr:kinase-like domain-containing protein [Trametes maxima]
MAKTPPSYIYLPPDAVRRQAELTRSGMYDLIPTEVPWKDRRRALEEKGYKLRARYQPGWEPSWMGTNLNPEFCEDFIILKTPDVMDAIRQTDGSCVALKVVKKNSQEVHIAQFLSSLEHPTNHCVPISDVLDDPLDASMSLLVTQYLRPWNDPEFLVLGDVVDFVVQMLEGLAFLHSHRVAHRDIASVNTMMDGRALYPGGHHPIWRDRSLDAIEDLIPLPRSDNTVKYFYVDFGLSAQFPPGSSSFVIGDVGRDAEVPELSSTTPYDAFKADIYALGNLFHKELEQQYHGLDCLRSLVGAMKQRDPELRPTADQLVTMFKDTRKTLTSSNLRWRIGSRSEPIYERLFNDTVAVTKDGLSRLGRFVRPYD